jgi:hypothetical protein
MWVSLRNSASCLIAASLALLGAAARADELLVMPYSCSVVGGQPVLTRARDEGHRVIGRREQRNFTACSPINPDMCRQWTVYRFDLDCDGAKVPWVSVVAAAAAGQRSARAWVEDGRLRLDMGPRWGMAPDDPCVRVSPYDDRGRYGRMGRYCADRRALGNASLVEMPPGVAPMLGIDGIFVAGGAPSVAGAPSAAPPAAVSPPPPKDWRAESASPSLPEPAAKSARAENPQPRLPEPAAKTTTGQEVLAKARPQTETKQVETKPAPPPPAQPPAAAATPGGPVVPKIINRPDSAPAEASPPAPPVTVVPKTAATAETGPKLAAVAPARPNEAVTQERSSWKTAVNKEDDAPVSLLGAIRSPATGIGIGLVGLITVLLAAFALTRRRERAQLAGTPSRDFASVSLAGRAGGAQVAAGARRDRQQLSPHGQRPSSVPAPPPGPGTLTSWGDSIPQTRDEALQILGMGVSPDANLTAIKKIVDGLRLSWHPDHATGQADRQVRELRLKQINAAWEIIAGKRAEA